MIAQNKEISGSLPLPLLSHNIDQNESEVIMEDNYKTKKNLSILFDVPLKTLNNDLVEMRKLSRFQDFIIKPSHKRVYISVEGYRQYLKYKQSMREKAM